MPDCIASAKATPASWGLLLALAAWVVLPACSDARITAFSRNVSLATGGVMGTNGGGPTSGGSAGLGGGGSGGTAESSRLLDDFSDGDPQTITPGGWWYFRGDDTMPDNGTYGEFGADTERDSMDTRALHAHGAGFSKWGFFVGLDLPGQPDLDARGYTRLSFWARSEPSVPFRNLRVDVLDASNAATSVHFSSPIVLGTDWQHYSLPFRDFTRSDGASEPALDLSRLSAVEFWVPSSEAFDFWLDDVSLDP